MKAIKSRQRGTEGHRGAFWSRGNGRTEQKNRIVRFCSGQTCYNAQENIQAFTIVTSDREEGQAMRAKQAFTACPFSLHFADVLEQMKHG